jgi:hypothetical protein
MHVHPSNGPWPSLAAALEAEQRAAGRPGRSPAGHWQVAAQLLIILVLALLAASAFAKLPPPTEEAKALAAENAAKAAWADKVGSYQLCAATDRIADTYRKRAAADGKMVAPATPMPACVNPGPYVAAITPSASKPLEAAGAHSPPGNAISPPNTKVPSADIDKAGKK